VAQDGGQLLGFAFLLVGNRHDAEDLVQQALLRTAGRWPAARQSPARYSRTVLLNLVRDRWRARQRRHAETLSPDLTALPSASDAAAAVLDRLQEIAAAIILAPGQWDGWYAKWAEQYAQWAPGNLGQLTWPFRCLMDRDDITGRLGDIGCPAVIVHGSEDAAIPLARAEEMRDRLAGPATVTLIGGAAHASNLTHPGAVNAEIVNFLHRLAS